MITTEQYWLLIAASFWMVLTTIFYTAFFRTGGFLLRALSGIFAALLSLLIIAILTWVLVSGEGFPFILPNWFEGTHWQWIIESGLLLLWAGIGILFSQTFNERMPLFLRLALGLLLSFVLVRYFCGMLILISL